MNCMKKLQTTPESVHLVQGRRKVWKSGGQLLTQGLLMEQVLLLIRPKCGGQAPPPFQFHRPCEWSPTKILCHNRRHEWNLMLFYSNFNTWWGHQISIAHTRRAVEVPKQSKLLFKINIACQICFLGRRSLQLQMQFVVCRLSAI